MKKISWEIVLAGLLFIGTAAYLIVQKVESNNEYEIAVATENDFNTQYDYDKDIQSTIVINLEQLEELEGLEQLKDLENLEQLRKLEKLEKLDKLGKLKELIVHEVVTETGKGLSEALEEIESELAKENISISFSNENIIISSNYDEITEGEWANVSTGVYAYTKKFDISNIDDSEIIMSFGHITVLGTDSNEGSLTLKASGNINSMEDLQNELMINSDISEEKLKFIIQPQIEGDYNKAIQLEATLMIPSKGNHKTITEGGHIQVENIGGDQEITTKGGHIDLSNLSGTVNATTDGGHITGQTINADLKFVTSGGHLELLNGKGKAVLLTNGGHITAKNYDGEVTAKTSGGNIDLKLASFSAPIIAHTSAGNINLYSPTSINADLKAIGTKTYIEKYFDITGDVKKDTIKGKLGKGGYMVELISSHGNVYIKRNE